MLHGKLIGYQGDELTVGGFFFRKRNAAAEGTVEGVNAAAAPGDFDGVADGALYLAGGGAKAPGNGRVKLFGDAVDAVGLLDDQLDRLTQELISFDVCGDAETEKEIFKPSCRLQLNIYCGLHICIIPQAFQRFKPP